MSTSRQTTVWCDERNCHEFIVIDTDKAAQARREASGSGWSRVKGKDRCTKHTCSHTEAHEYTPGVSSCHACGLIYETATGEWL